VPTFSKEYIAQMKAFLRARFSVDVSDEIVLESCHSLFYIGRAHARCEALRKKRRGGHKE